MEQADSLSYLIGWEGRERDKSVGKWQLGRERGPLGYTSYILSRAERDVEEVHCLEIVRLMINEAVGNATRGEAGASLRVRFTRVPFPFGERIRSRRHGKGNTRVVFPRTKGREKS